MKALLLDTINKTLTEVNPKGLEDYYKMIDCDCIDIVTRKIRNKYFDIICDDEGLYKDDVLISAISEYGNAMLVGNLIITGLVDENGDLTDLTNSDIKYIKKYVSMQGTQKHPDGLLMLHSVGY